jgi:hypothetical protein
MSGTSHGKVNNNIPDEGFPQESHFAFLERHNVTWKMYYHDDPWMGPTFADLRVKSRVARMQEMPNFYTDLQQGTLPQFSLIEPRMATKSPTEVSNWQHPDNSVEVLAEQILVICGCVVHSIPHSPMLSLSLSILTRLSFNKVFGCLVYGCKFFFFFFFFLLCDGTTIAHRRVRSC